MKISLSLIAFVLLFSACGYFDDPGSTVILNVDNEFEIEMQEMLFDDHRELAINFKSIAKLECQETVLELGYSLIGNSINIGINDISLPTACNGEGSYPEGLVSFEAPIRRYELGIRVLELASQHGILSVTDQVYNLDLGDMKGYFIETPEVIKIPDNFVWGYYNARNVDEVEIIESFLKSNNLLSRPLTHLTPGNYSYFDIDNEGILSLTDLPTEGLVKTLAFDLSQLDDIKEVISNFKSAHPNLSILLNASDGSLL